MIINPFIIAIIFVVIIITIILVYFNLKNQKEYSDSKHVNLISGYGGCSVNLNNLPDIPEDALCCFVLDENTGDKWIPDGGTGYLLTQSPVYYLDACKGWCKGGYNSSKQCLDLNGNVDTSATTKFQSCVSTIEPINCTSKALPFAKIGVNEWYIKRIGTGDCVFKNC